MLLSRHCCRRAKRGPLSLSLFVLGALPIIAGCTRQAADIPSRSQMSFATLKAQSHEATLRVDVKDVRQLRDEGELSRLTRAIVAEELFRAGVRSQPNAPNHLLIEIDRYDSKRTTDEWDDWTACTHLGAKLTYMALKREFREKHCTTRNESVTDDRSEELLNQTYETAINGLLQSVNAVLGDAEEITKRRCATEAKPSTGHVKQSELEVQMTAQFPKLWGCYQRAQQKSPMLSGQLVLRVEADKRGTVTGACLLDNSLADLAMVDCLLFEARRLQLPAPIGGDLTFDYPMSFKPAQDD